MTRKQKGEVRIPADVDAWGHEERTAKALAKAGYIVQFLPAENAHDAKSPDILMNGVKWEMKSPKMGRLSAVERNLKKAYRQSENIIFDSQRMGRLPDKSIQKELIKQFSLTKRMKRLLFVNRKRQTIDISTLV
jgi:hypothetical protein